MRSTIATTANATSFRVNPITNVCGVAGVTVGTGIWVIEDSGVPDALGVVEIEGDTVTVTEGVGVRVAVGVGLLVGVGVNVLVTISPGLK